MTRSHQDIIHPAHIRVFGAVSALMRLIAVNVRSSVSDNDNDDF